MSAAPRSVGGDPLDPFELPEWLGSGEVTWSASEGVLAGPLVRGRLTGPREEELGCDLLAVDAAFPVPVTDDVVRRAAHQAWHHGQVHLLGVEDRLTLTVPGAEFTADRVLDAVGRLALAVAARPESYAVWLRIGAASRSRPGPGG
ncbi:hypothetical protein [Nocardioides sp.]|uniref:hypothetical protein n=1 Tax=Nocardioides sp. TaxID=35761 RepID=UPI0027325363|nr:hypothetical protein [Nocardioides sp.]MDP3889682.1 hypothetical protein [Nocardioides sp.]